MPSRQSHFLTFSLTPHLYDVSFYDVAIPFLQCLIFDVFHSVPLYDISFFNAATPPLQLLIFPSIPLWQLSSVMFILWQCNTPLWSLILLWHHLLQHFCLQRIIFDIAKAPLYDISFLTSSITANKSVSSKSQKLHFSMSCLILLKIIIWENIPDRWLDQLQKLIQAIWEKSGHIPDNIPPKSPFFA